METGFILFKPVEEVIEIVRNRVGNETFGQIPKGVVPEFIKFLQILGRIDRGENSGLKSKRDDLYGKLSLDPEYNPFELSTDFPKIADLFREKGELTPRPRRYSEYGKKKTR